MCLKLTTAVFLCVSVLAACAGDDAAGTADAAGHPSADVDGGFTGDHAGAGAAGASADASTDSGADATRSDAAADGGDTPAPDAGPVNRPHPLYPAFDLDSLPGAGGAASGPYEAPALPATTRNVSITTAGEQAAIDLLAACQTAGTAVTVPSSAGLLGGLDFGNVSDCDITLGADVVANFVYVGHLPGPTVAPTHRLRIRGGQLGSIIVDPGSTDIVFDGVIVNSGVVEPAQRSTVAIYLTDAGDQFVNRFAFVNSIIRMVATVPDGAGNTDGCAYLAANAHNVFFANDNVVTAGNRNAWGFRIGGGDNFIIVDSTVRVSFHKLIRMNDGPVDYVYVKGGTWMREATLTAGGLALNDAFAQLGDLGTDHVYIQDIAVHLLSPEPLSIGASNSPGQVGKSWELRRIAFHARSASVISDAILTAYASGCPAGATCDYGQGTHSYDYDDALSLPTTAWRSLPALADDDPDTLPTLP